MGGTGQEEPLEPLERAARAERLPEAAERSLAAGPGRGTGPRGTG